MRLRILPTAFLGLVFSLSWLACVGDTPTTTTPDSGASQGGEGQACYANGTCDAKLTCISKVCVALDSGGGNDAGADAPKPDSSVDAEAGVPVACSQYCNAVNSTCPGTYDPGSACLTICSNFLALGSSGDSNMNTVGCRMKAANCEVAGPLGLGQSGPNCGNGCDAYCAIAAGLCPTDYPDKTACGTWCAGMQLGAPGVQGNTLNCRMHWLMASVCSNAVMGSSQGCP